ncbi:uncharacterized protein TRIVIDRAFT_162615 [Trichoderma virens Gv29-8]|uniref:Uncharacterized protein n=1 Tax=Hypocrea virens (strain Gv29-8 / FGSC 10586) TaxID=413071 RepID=G9N9N1_HYPVG|nr:uncharacterized protein TRIVIDRAFT_162615 [Trichoderma virens Gv29-8]EHK16649.1 hypothetical protein TRIVIDRAFT_162615 [Trichoderma virens Gv29-8]
MPTTLEWLKLHITQIRQLQQSDGYHEDEDTFMYLGDYFDGNLTTNETAILIAAPVLDDPSPPTKLYRLMGLLCEALVELSDEREKLLSLLESIQELPPAAINWAVLPGLRNMWREPIPENRQTKMRQHYTAIGTVEAELYDRGLGGVTENWGYELLNLACLRRPGLEVIMGEIHAWLTVAGTKLLKDLNPDEVRNWSRPVLGGQPGQQHAVQGTMAQHWETWRRTLLQLSEEKDFLSAEARRLARECHLMMQGHI